MRATLIPLDGSPAIEINKDLMIIGRNEGCDIRLDHKSVSKQHCVLSRTDGLLMLRDLGSTNGTKVNNVRVRRAALLPNDQLSIAQFKFKVVLGPLSSHNENARGHDHTQVITDASMPLPSVSLPARQAIQRNALPDAYE
ncbi:MAG: FHA domain-containing protein [Gemmataceae bacterium]